MTSQTGLRETRDGSHKKATKDSKPSAPAQEQSGLFGFCRRLFASYRPEKRYMRGSDSLTVREAEPCDPAPRRTRPSAD